MPFQCTFVPVPTVSCSVLFLLEFPLPPNRLLGWLTIRESVSRGFRAAFTVFAMLGLTHTKEKDRKSVV